MALLFIDGFDVDDSPLKYPASSVTLLSNTYTRLNSGRSCQGVPTGGGGQTMLYKTFAAAPKIIVGFALSHDSFTSASENDLLYLLGDSGTTKHLTLTTTGTGVIKLYRGDSSGTLLGSYTSSIKGTTWSYLEMSATIDDVTGTGVVRQNGAVVISFAGDTKNAGTNTSIDKFIITANNSSYRFIDDLYVCDGSGAANNDFLGDVRVQTLFPTAAGSSTQLTPSVGANWDNVNDVPYDATTYNSSSTVGQRDTYIMGDLNAGTGTVFGVKDNMIAQKSDAGAASMKAALKSGATVYYDTTAVLGTAISSSSAIRETDPATSAAWTATNVNSIEFGAEVA